jgi:hypothetical protein
VFAWEGLKEICQKGRWQMKSWHWGVAVAVAATFCWKRRPICESSVVDLDKYHHYCSGASERVRAFLRVTRRFADVCLQLQPTPGNNLSTRPWNSVIVSTYLSLAHHQSRDFITSAHVHLIAFQNKRLARERAMFDLRRALLCNWPNVDSQPAGKLRPPFDNFDGARN